jgi:hypothetical protein
LANERNPERRPDPDALLALADKEKRGRLLVFLGAAPGVGKTYAMLQRARLLRQEGVDVVIGLVETHGRNETEALIRDLEILPRRVVRWQDRQIEEFDLDGALRRRPKLIVVDELAHTNAPESRHPKRWQDVEELLNANIDVWTALNIQHLESLADVVSRVTGVTVRETVPDIVLRDADDIVLVDITSEELIQRLRDGKVYLPETAKLAQQKFFTLRNLTALRELALRRTAARVDDQMVEQLRQSAIEGPWETAERLLVCVGPDELSIDVVRAASRLATGLNASWVAVTVDTPGYGDEAPAKSAKRVDDALRLAQSLGAEVTRLVSRNPALRAARELHPDRRRTLAGRLSLPSGRTLPVGGAGPARPTHRRACRHRRRAPRDDATMAARRFPDARPANRRFGGGRLGRRGGRCRRIAQSVAAPAQSVDDLPDRGAVLRCALRRALRGRGGRSFLSRLRFLLRRAAVRIQPQRAV